jgi:hypothetical protein
VKWQALHNRLAALSRALPGKGTVLRITGGLPPDFKPPAAKPLGSDLKTQHQIFTASTRAPSDETAEGVKRAVRGS